MKHHQIIICLALLIGAMGGCTYEMKVKDGADAYERKQFAEAIPMLKKEFQRSKDASEKGKIAYLLAESYRRTHDAGAAADWYNQAIQQRYFGDASIKYARMLQQLQQYDDAAKAYQSAGRADGDVNLYREQVIACRKAKEWLGKADSNDFKVTALPFNTPDTDFSPVMYEDNKLLFSSDRSESEGKDLYKWTGEKFFDLYTLDIPQHTVQRFESPFNKEFHQGTFNFNADRTEAYFTQCGSKNKTDTDYCQIWRVRKNGDAWGNPEQVDLGMTNSNLLHPAVVREGTMLIFAADHSGGYGGYDLYYSLWVATDKRWDKPRNMGASINTKGNEVFPFMDADTLYFSSDGQPGMGGLDLFRIEKFYDRWQNLQNLKAPMNSGGDDFGIAIDYQSPRPDSVLRTGYFTSAREGGKGSDDIYRFVQQVPKPKPVPAVVDTPKIVFRLRLEGLVKESVYKIAGNPNSGIADYQALMGASVQISNEDTVFTLGSEADGSFRCELVVGKEYELKATKKGYFNGKASLSTKEVVLTEQQPEQVLTVELLLDRIFTNQEIVLKNIYYDYDRDNIRDDAKPTLDSLTQILLNNPDIHIQLSSHTDCRGTDTYNQDLSQRRAESAVRYLVQKGIVPERLTARGYGESKPEAVCKCNQCTEDEHQTNRRTTFMVLEKS